MNKNDWIAVAAIIIPSLAILIGAAWQAKATRATSQRIEQASQKTLKPAKGRIWNVLFFLFVMIIGVCLPGFNLYQLIQIDEPISKGTIIRIAIYVSVIFFNLGILYTSYFVLEIVRILEKMLASLEGAYTSIKTTVSLVSEFSKGLESKRKKKRAR